MTGVLPVEELAPVARCHGDVDIPVEEVGLDAE